MLDISCNILLRKQVASYDQDIPLDRTMDINIMLFSSKFINISKADIHYLSIEAVSEESPPCRGKR